MRPSSRVLLHLMMGRVRGSEKWTIKYGCESWTIKKAEHWNWCFWTVVLEKTFESPLDCKKMKPVNPKGNRSWISIGRTDAKAEVLTMAYRTPDPVLPLPELLLGSSVQFSSVQPLSCVQLCDPMNCSTPSLPVHHQLWVYSNSCPLSQWCHPAIEYSVVPLSSCLQSFPASGSFLMSQLFASGDQIIGTSTSVSVEYLGLISFRIAWFVLLVSKGLSRVFFITTVWKHQFFSSQPSL